MWNTIETFITAAYVCFVLFVLAAFWFAHVHGGGAHALLGTLQAKMAHAHGLCALLK